VRGNKFPSFEDTQEIVRRVVAPVPVSKLLVVVLTGMFGMWAGVVKMMGDSVIGEVHELKNVWTKHNDEHAASEARIEAELARIATMQSEISKRLDRDEAALDRLDAYAKKVN